MPMIPATGLLISWATLARRRDLASDAFSALSRPARALGQHVALFQQGGDQQDRHIADQHKHLGHHDLLSPAALSIGSMPHHRPAHGQERDQDQGEGDARHAQPHRDDHEQGQQEEARRKMTGEPGVIEAQQAGQQHGRLDHLVRTGQTNQGGARQRQTHRAQDGDAQGMAQPPGLKSLPDLRLAQLHLNHDTAQSGGKRRQTRREEQETGRPVQGRQVQRRREAPRQQHRPDDFDHVDDGEGQSQQGPVAGDDLSDQDAHRQHPGERQVVGPPPAGPQPHGDGDAARPQKPATSPAERP